MSELYDVVCADPPWTPVFGKTSSRSVTRHYQTMTTEDICAFEVPAAHNSLLFLWATAPMLLHALKVLEAWGYSYRSGMIWDKGKAGTGKWVRGQHEHILIGRRGKFPAPSPGTLPVSVIQAPRRAHSQKPEELQDMVERVYPGLRYLELFARRRRPGWTCVGDEL